MDEGKEQALFEICYLASKEGGYSKESVKNFSQLSKEYIIPMISALVNEKLVSTENEFDEAMYVLDQYSPKIVKEQLKVEKAKSGDKIEIMKFFIALVYEFRVRHSTVFSNLCKLMSGANQQNIAHFIVYLDNSIAENDSDWWKILFMSYSNDDLARFGAVNDIRASCKTPMQSPDSDNTFDIIVNSPAGKDRLIKEYERRLKAERELVQSLQSHFDELYDENSNLKVEVDLLKEKLKTTSKPRDPTCSEDCPNKNEVAAMKIMLTVRDNKVQNLTADLHAVQNELELTNEAADKALLENRQLKERTELLNSEIDRLRHVSNELHEARRKLLAITKEHDDLWIKSSLNSDLSSNVRQLSKENGQLRNQNEELTARLSSMEKTINELRLSSDAKDKRIAELLAKLEKKDASEEGKKLQTYANENKRLKDEMAKIRGRLASEKSRADNFEKRYYLLEQQHKSEMKNSKQVQSAYPKAGKSSATPYVKKLKPVSEPPELMRKSITSSDSGFSVPLFTGGASNPKRRPFVTKATPNEPPKFEYNYENRLEIVQERNRKLPPHMRSHYATEQESGLSTLQTTKFPQE